MFIPNENFSGFISPFQANLLWSYKAEYNLEMSRRKYFIDYPSRLRAIFLFDTEEEARKYHNENARHVEGRKLILVKSVGKYCFSKHDCNWIDFLRLKVGSDNNTIHSICESYWKGNTVESNVLLHRGHTWKKSPIFEIIYLGVVKKIKEM